MEHAAATTKTWRKNAIYMSQQHAECSQQHAECSSMLCWENQNFKKNDNHQFYIPLRNCIYFTGYDAQYLSSPGGLDVVEVYFQNDLALNLEALQPLRRGTLEHQHLLSETLDRAEKYANRW